jgi:hypothetical protein
MKAPSFAGEVDSFCWVYRDYSPHSARADFLI